MDEIGTVIFDTALAPNGQVTVKKQVRELLGLEPGDQLWLEVKRVISKKGEDKYPVKSP